MARDFYTILALQRNATEDQIRHRFRELARLRHPDRFRGAEKEVAEREFQEITQAFNVLVDNDRRRQYDSELARPSESDPRQMCRAYLQRGIKAYKEKSYLEDREAERSQAGYIGRPISPTVPRLPRLAKFSFFKHKRAVWQAVQLLAQQHPVFR
jgi:curved DNA-binding protein CbpA